MGTNLLFAQDPTWFTDVTHNIGLDSARGSRVAWVDVNNDNYPDILWGTGDLIKNHIFLYLNVPDPDHPGQRKFVDFTKESNINQNRDPQKDGRVADVAVMADVDNDGDMDLVTSIYYHRYQFYDTPEEDPGDRSEVLLNDGTGRFTLVKDNGIYNMTVVDSFAVGLINATGIAFLDYDFDGNIDMYISTWFSDYAANLAHGGIGYKMKDVLLKGNGDGSFVKIDNAGTQYIAEPMYGVNVTDWDNDGWPDILTSAYCRSGGTLYRNNHDGTFTDATWVSDYSGQKLGGDHGQALCQWEALPGDFDNDGDMDLLQVEVHGGNDDSEGRTHVTINEGPENNYKLVWDMDRLQRDAPKSTTHFGDQGGCWFDMDGDGWLDIAVGNVGYEDAPSGTNMQGQVRLYICKQDSNHYFHDVSKAIGIYDEMKSAHSMEPGDFDLDGDQDLLFSRLKRDTIEVDSVIDGVAKKVKVPRQWMQVNILQNNIGSTHNWVSVKLDPPKGVNGSALGSRIYVYAGGLNQIGELQAGMGHFGGMQPFIRNFGLGDKNFIDSVVVRWPGKDIPNTVVKNPPLNTILYIDQNGLKSSLVKNYSGTKPIIASSIPYLVTDIIHTGESRDYPLTLMNLGDSLLTIRDMTFTGDDGSFQVVDKQNGYLIPPGGSQEFILRFTPNARKYYPAKLHILSDAFNQPGKIIDLNAYGFEEQPMIAFGSTQLYYDSLFLGGERTLPVILRNRGELDLNITGLQFLNDDKNVFSLPDNFSGITLKPGDSTVINVKLTAETGFKFTGIFDYTADLGIESNAYNQDTNKISLRGTVNGPAPEVNVSRSIIFLPTTEVGKSVESDFDVSNPGNAPLTVNSLTIDEDVDGAYTFPGTELPFTVKQGQSKNVTLKFSPKEAKKYIYKLAVNTNAYKDSVWEITIRGNGSEPQAVAPGDIAGSGIDAEIVPNPLSGSARLYIHNPKNVTGPESIRVYDIYGNCVMNIYEGVAQSGELSFPLNMSGYASGIYYVVVRNDGYPVKIPLILVK